MAGNLSSEVLVDVEKKHNVLASALPSRTSKLRAKKSEPMLVDSLMCAQGVLVSKAGGRVGHELIRNRSKAVAVAKRRVPVRGAVCSGLCHIWRVFACPTCRLSYSQRVNVLLMAVFDFEFDSLPM